jgi:ABC-2 type transport system ATP-binding protein
VSTLAAPRPSRPPPRGGSAPPAVRLAGVEKSFPVQRGWRESIRHPRARRSVAALRGVTCDVRRGELFGVLGPNGAGKTTLFKILSTLVLPDAGRVEVEGVDAVRRPADVRRLLCPVVADERSLNWRLTARENLRLYAALHGLRGAAVLHRVDEVLAQVELDDARDRRVGTFSSGMKQRLLLARALLARPRVLLLDEPTRSLDPLSARRFRAFLRDEVVGRQGCTVLLATHAPDEALALCDRVGVLHRGRLLAVGTAESLARRHARDRWRLSVRDPLHPALAAAARRGLLHVEGEAEDEDGWTRIDAVVPGGTEGAARLLAALVEGGAAVSRMEPARPSLAELIERIVAEGEG